MRAKFVNESSIEQDSDYQKRIASIERGINYMFNDEKEANKELQSVVNYPLQFKSNFESGDVEITGTINGKPVHITGLEARTIFHFLCYVKLTGWKKWEEYYDYYAKKNGFENYFLIKGESFESPEVEKGREEFNRIGAAKSFAKAINKKAFRH